MTIRKRIPYVFLFSFASALLAFAAWNAWRGQLWVDLGIYAAAAAAVLLSTVVLAVHGLRRWLPEWAHRYELVAVDHGPAITEAGVTSRIGCVLRCNRCDATVLPFAPTITLPRLLTYAHLHTVMACEPRRASDPDDTRRLSPERRRHLLRLRSSSHRKASPDAHRTADRP